MKQRVTFGSKDKRSDQRRSIMLPGSIDGIQVKLVDVSFTGIGGEVREKAQAAELTIGEDETSTLEFTTGDGQVVALQISIQRVDLYTGEFGAIFTALTSKQFDAIEGLMFPRRGGQP